MSRYIHDDLPAFVAIYAYKSVFRQASWIAAARPEQKRNLLAAMMAQTALGSFVPAR